MIIGYILILLAIAEVVIGLRFIFGYQHSLSVKFFGAFALASAVYVGANGLGYVGNVISGDMAEHLAWTGAILATIAFLPFTYSFPVPRRQFRELFPWLLWPIVIFVFGLLGTDLFIRKQGIVHFGVGYTTATGQYFWLIILFLLAYWTWSIRNLLMSYHRSDGVHRWQLKILLIGVVISVIFSLVFDVLLPFISATRFGFVGSFMTTAWLGVTSYIILKR